MMRLTRCASLTAIVLLTACEWSSVSSEKATDGPEARDASPVMLEHSPPYASEILERATEVYRTSRSYQDAGVVRTVYVTPQRERIGETRFKTAYVAPIDFRFESRMGDFGGDDVVFIVAQGSAGLETYFSSDPELMKTQATIQGVLDAAAGISRDTSGMIPGIIFPGSKLGGDIVELTDVVRLKDESIDGVECFRVQGFRWPNTGTPTSVWIDKENFLIRQVYEEQTLNDLHTRTTWSYKPEVNAPVSAAALAPGI